MKKIILFTFLIFIAQVLSAQDNRSRIRVTDKNDRPLSDVVVKIEGNLLESFVTDKDGYVELPATKGDRLLISRFNQLQTTVELDDTDTKIQLQDNNLLLDLGYDIKATNEESAAAISGISSEEFKSSHSRNVLKQLYGRIPGLMLNQGNTNPWDLTPDFYVRGKGSFSDNHTLILVDGIERDVTLLNSNEIESVVVMKDAASLALYGNRGADGIINFITKRGGDHGMQIKTGYRASIDQAFRIPEMANAYVYSSALNEALRNDNLPQKYSPNDLISMYNGDKRNLLPDVDWKSEMLRKNAFSNSANLEINGSNKRSRYYVYTNYTSHYGLLNNTNLNENYSTQVAMHSLKVRSNLETYITPTTIARMNVMGRLMQYQQPTSGLSLNGIYNVPSAAFPVRNEQNLWVQNQMFENPLANITARGYNVVLQRSILTDITIDQNLDMLLQGLSAQIRLAYDNSADITDSKSKEYAYMQFNPIRGATGNVDENIFTKYGNDTELAFNSWLSNQVMRTTFWSKIAYNNNIGKHQLDISGIYGQVSAKYAGANNSFMYRDYLANLDYNYDNRYLLQGVLNISGSAKLPKNDKYRIYPAISAAWVLSNEDFFGSYDNLDYLKLRVSSGVTGMDRNLLYDMDKQFNGVGLSYIFVGNKMQNGLGEGALGSYLIEPEKELKNNIGLDMRLFKNLTIGLDAFYNHRKNIRVATSSSISNVIGIGMTDISIGEVKNMGAEISVGWSGKVNNFTYSVNSHVAFQKNEILSISEEYVPYSYMSRKGKSTEALYGLIYDGLYQESDFNDSGNLKEGLVNSAFIQSLQPGDVKYKDLNNDGIINEYDYSYLTNSLPEIYFGTNIQMAFKDWSLFMNFQGVGKSTITTELESIYWPLYGNNKNVSVHYLRNRWTSDTPDAKYPRLTNLPNENNFRGSTLWTEKGDYLKLRDIELSYNLPAHLFNDITINECRVYISGTDLFSLDHVDIMDPDHISMYYPTTKSFSLGVNLVF